MQWFENFWNNVFVEKMAANLKKKLYPDIVMLDPWLTNLQLCNCYEIITIDGKRTMLSKSGQIW